MQETGIATVIEKLGKIISELENQVNYERYRSDELAKENAELKKKVNKLRIEVVTPNAPAVTNVPAEPSIRLSSEGMNDNG